MSENAGPAEGKPPHLDRLSALWRRLSDHKIAQWSVAYVALGYAIQHGVILTAESYEWPNIVPRVSMTLLALGLPLVMTFAWYHGARASRNFSRAEISIVTGLLVTSSLLFYLFVRPSEQAAAPAAQQASVTPARAASADPRAISLAVLPFVNLSSDKEQEFFSDGITEEITSALAKVPGLTVIGRTSAFEFKGQNKDLRAIGQALGTTHLIEGSVRKAGNRVRITAQLIEADKGAHLWTESYDRQLTDIFAIQEEIAEAIAGALRKPLGLAPGDSLVSNRTIDPESYQQFLRARMFRRNRANQAEFREDRYAGAIRVLEQVVAQNPSYAPAWAELAMMTNDPAQRETAAQEAIRLDSRSAPAYAALAQLQNVRGNLLAGEDLYRQALALDPNDPDVLDAYSLRLVFVGRIKEAANLRAKLRRLEPFVPNYNAQTANIVLIDGQNQAAIAILEALPAGSLRNISLAHAYAAEGRYGAAADTLLSIPTADRTVSRQTIEDAARLLRNAPTKVKAPESLPVFTGALNYVYGYVGAPDRGLDDPERSFAQHRLALPQVRHLWSPEYAPIRKTERFKALMRKMGNVDYWRARGWSDFCRPMGADDFVCD